MGNPHQNTYRAIASSIPEDIQPFSKGVIGELNAAGPSVNQTPIACSAQFKKDDFGNKVVVAVVPIVSECSPVVGNDVPVKLIDHACAFRGFILNHAAHTVDMNLGE